MFLKRICTLSWIFSWTYIMYFKKILLISTKIGQFSLPWQGHTLDIEPASIVKHSHDLSSYHELRIRAVEVIVD